MRRGFASRARSLPAMDLWRSPGATSRRAAENSARGQRVLCCNLDRPGGGLASEAALSP
jgi:hypothetical protein